MQPRQTLDLAALVALAAGPLVEQAEPLPAEPLEQYWVSTRARLDRWAGELKRFVSRSSVAAAPELRQRAKSVMEEVLVTEVLARVWTATVAAHDRRRGRREAEPVAQSVLVGHLDARQRVLGLLLDTPKVSVPDAVALNRLRYRTEYWADLLLAGLAPWIGPGEFACDPIRTDRWADYWRAPRGRGNDDEFRLLLGALEVAFRQVQLEPSLSGELNARIAASLCEAWDERLRDSWGLWRSLWSFRLEAGPAETQVLIDQYLHREEPRGRTWPAALPPGRDRWPPFRLER